MIERPMVHGKEHFLYVCVTSVSILLSPRQTQNPMWVPIIMLFITSYFSQKSKQNKFTHHCNLQCLLLPKHMALLISIVFFFLFSIFPLSNNAQAPPSPGYYPSSRVGSIGFNQGFTNLWGPQHQSLDHGLVTIWLDQTSGTWSCLDLVFYSASSLVILHACTVTHDICTLATRVN